MKNFDLYARLELISLDCDSTGDAKFQNKTPVWARLRAWLKPLGRSLLAYLCGSSEPQITTRQDASGNPCFSAYDPVSQQHYTFATEQELRIWLDQRYYQ